MTTTAMDEEACRGEEAGMGSANTSELTEYREYLHVSWIFNYKDHTNIKSVKTKTAESLSLN